ncbi:hypothetical protein H2198_007216 [Neophaeococcomyces mojaviensis]|uniref:Uncharacterized protein n=1 Tax=Neophaeococcomyces mojaviensis TaxID=3383035 RepID=A0ACC3A0S7_9EURO|nr:hypothetical protein H2198_007216 [Knufia sp. JES_112]
MHTNQPAGLPCSNSSASFWHSEPNAFLYGHRTTADLPAKADIVIVGSGITGASVARFLAADSRASKLSIVMLEAREICWGATGRNGGHCQPLLFDRTPDVAGFEVKNVHAVKSYIDEHNVPCEWRSVTGCRSFWTAESFNAAKTEVEQLAKANKDLASKVSLIEHGDAKTMKQHRVNPNAKGVTLTQGAGQLWPYKYVTFIVEKLVRESMINVQTNTPVKKIETMTDSQYRQQLTTPRGQISARHVILATNGYTSHLLNGFTDLIVPVRCEMSALHPPPGSERLPNSYGMVGFENGNIDHDDYLIQRPFYDSSNGDGTRRGGHLMFGGGRSFAMYNCIGETDDDIVDPGEADYLRRALLQMLELEGETEGMKELKASHQWTGIKGYSRDNMPWVGKVPSQENNESFENGLWLCGGYTGHGMPNATLCGKAVVEMVLAEEQGNTNYESICEKLVKDQDIPQIYLITHDRLKAAHGLPSVVEQDAAGGVHAVASLKKKPNEPMAVRTSKCTSM